MRAKFQCNSVTNYGPGEKAELSAVYGDGNPENNQFNNATPYAELKIQIDNPSARGYFKPGKTYYLDFTEVQDK